MGGDRTRAAWEGGGLGAVKGGVGDAGREYLAPEADGNRVGLLGAHRPRDKQVLLVPRPSLPEIRH